MYKASSAGDSTSASLLPAGLCLVSILLLLIWHRRPKRFPPGPRGYPLVGTIPQLVKFGAPVKMFEWSKIYGEVMSVRMGRSDVVVLSGKKVIHDAFVKTDAFAGRPFSFVMHQVLHRNNGLIYIDNDQKWKSQRQFCTRTIKGIGVGRKSIEERVIEEMEFFVDSLAKKEGKPFSPRHDIASAVANITLSVVLGNRLEYSGQELQRLVQIFDESFTQGSTAVLYYMTTFEKNLRFVPPFRQAYLEIAANLEEVREFARKEIRKHIDTFDKNDIRDVCDAFYAEMVKEKSLQNGYFTMDQLVHLIQDLMLGGFETSSSTLLWCLLGLFHCPDAQGKIYAEIKEVIGEDGQARLRHRSSMPYTMAFIDEIHRLRQVGPLFVPHKATRDVEINGYLIPKNTEVLGSAWSIHRDPSVWEDPDKFVPERHINEEGRHVSSDSVVPFSMGPRRCPGEDIAKTEIFLFLVTLLQKFNIVPDPDDRCPPSFHKGIFGSAYVPEPFNVVLQTRC